MDLTFNSSGILKRGRGLTYDDVLIVPSKSAVRSRRDPNLTAQLTKRFRGALPMISANMDTVTGSDMAIAMRKIGGLGILHRFMSPETQLEEVRRIREAGVDLIAASIGVTKDERPRAEALVKEGVHILTIDIAHGHSESMLETLKWLRDKFSDQIDIIAGNVATPEATSDLIDAGADAIKVGIGPGSMCTTRIITGCGVPQLTAVAWCSEVARERGAPVIADGGLRTSGDIVKALAAGAQSVMLGSLLSGTLETPGPVHNGRKHYRGMASKAAQVSWRGELPEGMAPEGESTSVAVKGHVKDVVLELAGGLRSGMSYINANDLNEIPEKARFIEMSLSGARESMAHGVK
ncbi:MAG TPA: IMP dehydrogenase [Bdellovibrionales bacterium]|nr:IMP dehydrogenase [Bdellovibrionales bacterium]